MKSTDTNSALIDGSPAANALLSSQSLVATPTDESQAILTDAVVVLNGALIGTGALNLLRNILNAVSVEADDSFADQSFASDIVVDGRLTEEGKKLADTFSHLLSTTSRLLPDEGQRTTSVSVSSDQEIAVEGVSEAHTQQVAGVSRWYEEAITRRVQGDLALRTQNITALQACLSQEVVAFRQQAETLARDAREACAELIVDADEFANCCHQCVQTVEEAYTWLLAMITPGQDVELALNQFRDLVWAAQDVMLDEAEKLINVCHHCISNRRQGKLQLMEVLEPVLKEKNAQLDRATIEAAAYQEIPDVDEFRRKDFDAVVEKVRSLVIQLGGIPCDGVGNKYRTLLKNLSAQELTRYNSERRERKKEVEELREQFPDAAPASVVKCLKSKAPEAALFQRENPDGKWGLDRKEFKMLVRQTVELILGEDHLDEIVHETLAEFAAEKLHA